MPTVNPISMGLYFGGPRGSAIVEFQHLGVNFRVNLVHLFCKFFVYADNFLVDITPWSWDVQYFCKVPKLSRVVLPVS